MRREGHVRSGRARGGRAGTSRTACVRAVSGWGGIGWTFLVTETGERKNLPARGRRRFGEHREVALAYIRRRRLLVAGMASSVPGSPANVKPRPVGYSRQGTLGRNDHGSHGFHQRQPRRRRTPGQAGVDRRHRGQPDHLGGNGHGDRPGRRRPGHRPRRADAHARHDHVPLPRDLQGPGQRARALRPRAPAGLPGRAGRQATGAGPAVRIHRRHQRRRPLRHRPVDQAGHLRRSDPRSPLHGRQSGCQHDRSRQRQLSLVLRDGGPRHGPALRRTRRVPQGDPRGDQAGGRDHQALRDRRPRRVRPEGAHGDDRDRVAGRRRHRPRAGPAHPRPHREQAGHPHGRRRRHRCHRPRRRDGRRVHRAHRRGRAPSSPRASSSRPPSCSRWAPGSASPTA